MQVAPTTPPPSGGQQRDWSPIVSELQAMAEDALGNRARKVKDILGAADPSESGIEGAIDQIPSISLLFVDSSRLEQLAHEMRARLKSHLQPVLPCQRRGGPSGRCAFWRRQEWRR